MQRKISDLEFLFRYRWEDESTIPEAAKIVDAVEAQANNFLKDPGFASEVTHQSGLARVWYKLGTYYLHAKDDPVKAMEKFDKAEAGLSEGEITWLPFQKVLCKLEMVLREPDQAEKIAQAKILLSSSKELLTVNPEHSDGFMHLAFTATLARIQSIVDPATAENTYFSVRHTIFYYHSDFAMKLRQAYITLLLDRGHDHTAGEVLNSVERHWSASPEKVGKYQTEFWLLKARYLETLLQSPYEYEKEKKLLATLEAYKKAAISDNLQDENIIRKVAEYQVNVANKTLENVMKKLEECLAPVPADLHDRILKNVMSSIYLRGRPSQVGMYAHTNPPPSPPLSPPSPPSDVVTHKYQ